MVGVVVVVVVDDDDGSEVRVVVVAAAVIGIYNNHDDDAKHGDMNAEADVAAAVAAAADVGTFVAIGSGKYEKCKQAPVSSQPPSMGSQNEEMRLHASS